MNENNNTAMMQQTYAPFVLPNMVQGEFTDADLMDDMDGITPSFQRVKIPGGGVPQFEMPGEDPAHPVYEQRLEGIIVYSHLTNAYWPEGSEYEDDVPPLCQSTDAKLGYGTPGGACAACALNAFGSVSNGRGKACKNMRSLYLLRSGDMMPLILNLPPTSLKPYNDFVNAAFLYRRRPVYASVVEITLKRTSSNGFDYSVAVFSKVRDFEGEELANVTQYVTAFREQAKISLAQRAEMNKTSAQENAQIDAGTMQLPDNEEHFSIEGAAAAAPVIYGERDKLPA